MTQPIPAGFTSLTPNLTVADGSAAIDFYVEGLGAEVVRRYDHDGRVMHSELRLGDAMFYVSESYPEFGLEAPAPGGTVQCSFTYWCEDADAAFARAVAAGAREVSPVAPQFSGQRLGSVRDPFGHRWVIATQVEDVSEPEIQRRMEEMLSAT